MPEAVRLHHGQLRHVRVEFPQSALHQGAARPAAAPHLVRRSAVRLPTRLRRHGGPQRDLPQPKLYHPRDRQPARERLLDVPQLPARGLQLSKARPGADVHHGDNGHSSLLPRRQGQGLQPRVQRQHTARHRPAGHDPRPLRQDQAGGRANAGHQDHVRAHPQRAAPAGGVRRLFVHPGGRQRRQELWRRPRDHRAPDEDAH
mmetsp:Transcript_4266/g.12434  ORF Transcript_4266/g.12434 Transcript_4266/m.12434 type:complete len:202 (+) Transcript_4266:1303-1908(+)